MENNDYEEKETFQTQAFTISEPGPDFDPESEPTNGEEYLMHMIYERKRCPAVVVAKSSNENKIDCDPPSVGVHDDFIAPISDVSPTTEWKDIQITSFRDARDRILYMRCALKAQSPRNAKVPPPNAISEWYEFCRRNPPLVSTVLRIDQYTLRILLDHVLIWLIGDEDADDQEVTGPSLDLDCANAWLGRWLYGILMCLQWPIEPSVHGTLRQIARVCLRNRNNLQPHETQKAAPYNIFICLIVKFFDQLDFDQYL